MDMQYGNMKGHVSKRALEGMAVANPMRDALFSALKYIYDPVHPAINMGTAQNDLMQKELVDKVYLVGVKYVLSHSCPKRSMHRSSFRFQ